MLPYRHRALRARLRLLSLESRIAPSSTGADAWHALPPIPVGPAATNPDINVRTVHPFALDRAALDPILAAAPPESAGWAGSSPVTLALPTPDGGFAHF